MPKGRQILARRSKDHTDGVSLKGLHDSEDELEAELGLCSQQDSLDEAAPNLKNAGIQTFSPLKTSVNAESNSSPEESKNNSDNVKSSKEDIENKASSRTGNMSLSPKINSVEKDVGNQRGVTHSRAPSSRSSLLVSSLEGVEEHPLLCQSSSSDSDEIVENTSKPSPGVGSIQESQSNQSITRGMLSNAFFDTKARTQLITTLKKNIQHYTSSAVIGKSEPTLHSRSSADTSEIKTRSSSLSADNQFTNALSSRSDTVKVLKGKAMEPLQAVRRVFEDSLKDSQLAEDESTVRKRSSSESNSADSNYIFRVAKHSDPDNMHAQASKPSTAVPRSSSIAVSLSNLLAEREETKDDVAIDVPKPVKNDLLPKKEAFTTSKQKSYVVPKRASQTGHEGLTVKSDNKKSSPSIHVLFPLSLAIYLYYTLPLPLYVHVAVLSFFFGVGISLSILCFVVSPPKPTIASKPPYTTQTVPSEVPKTVLDLDQAFKGWMNEIELYDIETYHTSATFSVFVTLEGSTLRLQTPRRNIPRRASHGERTIQVTNVIRQRLYDISKAKVYLVPSDLVKKRVWSKKYPICLEFSDSSIKGASPETTRNATNIESENAAPEAYDVISKEDLTEKIYLFGRTQPQKERWFYRFQRAIAVAQKKVGSTCNSPAKDDCESGSEAVDLPSTETLDDKSSGAFDPVKIYEKYYMYMCSLMPDPNVYSSALSETGTKATQKSSSLVDLDQSKAIQFSSLASQADGIHDVVLSQPKPILGNLAHEPGLDVAWFNIVVGRIMFDFLRLRKWADWVSNKIQKKLEKIRLPYFMDGLKLTEMDLGKTVPLVQKISLPRLDGKGIWLDMDITYNGAVQMTLETKMVLTRLGKQKTDQMKTDKAAAAMNSDEEDSAESSEDEESLITSSLPTYVQHFVPKGSENVSAGTKTKTGFAKASSSSPKQPNSGTSPQEKRWVRIVDSITKSKYFQKVTETNYIKKKLETVSNTPLILTAELNQCQGTICINIPPPPSDRVWYGFKEPPVMVLKAHPKLGERVVKATPVTDWIEKKLIQEFNKVFLIPNMDDIPVPLMFNNLPSST